jgi:hypothetical protein
MASSRGMAPTVLLPTVPSMPTGAAPRATKGTSTKASSRVVKVPGLSHRTTPKLKAPHIRVAKPKMPKDALLLGVPKAKRVKNGKEFSTKRKPII